MFWEGHKILRNLHLTFDYSTYSQKLGEDFAKFCAFSEYMNFKWLKSIDNKTIRTQIIYLPTDRDKNQNKKQH